MIKTIKKHLVPAAAILAFGTFIFWFTYNPVKDFTSSVPGMDSVPALDSASLENVIIGEFFNRYASSESNLKGKWVRFRGAQSDNIVKDGIPLVDSFGASGPKIDWEVDLGEGHAAPVIYNGKVYLLDYLELKKKMHCGVFRLKPVRNCGGEVIMYI